MEAGQRTPALRFGDSRIKALPHALCRFAHLPRGFRNADGRTHVGVLPGPLFWTPIAIRWESPNPKAGAWQTAPARHWSIGRPRRDSRLDWIRPVNPARASSAASRRSRSRFAAPGGSASAIRAAPAGSVEREHTPAGRGEQSWSGVTLTCEGASQGFSYTTAPPTIVKSMPARAMSEGGMLLRSFETTVRSAQ